MIRADCKMVTLLLLDLHDTYCEMVSLLFLDYHGTC